MIKKIIKRAKELHLKDPGDAAHNLAHHQAVAANCEWIVKQEGLNSKVDINALLLAAWWHDLKRDLPQESNRLLRRTLEQAGAGNSFIKKVLAIINEHSFGKQQRSLEARILFDADKVEYVSLQRLKISLNAVKRGKMSKSLLQQYLKTWRDRITSVRKNMHFLSSKTRFDQKFEEAARYCQDRKGLSFVYSIWYNLYHGQKKEG
jgi:HD superfamily phosphohydrolase YqeK